MTARCSSLFCFSITQFISILILSYVIVISTCDASTQVGRRLESSLDFPRNKLCLKRCTDKNVKGNDMCYTNCLESLQTDTRPLKRTKRDSSGMANVYISDCPSGANTTRVRIGNITNLMIAFKQQYINKTGAWTANISWDVNFSNSSLYESDLWQGFLVFWTAVNNKSPEVGQPNCRFNRKNVTWIVIESAHNNGWLYPNAIDTSVMFYPIHEDDKSVFMQRFSTNSPTVTETTKTISELPLLQYIAIGIGVLTGVIILAITVWLYRKKKRSRTRSLDTSGERNFEYDTSILFSSQDEIFVIKKLIPFLEKKSHFKCFVHYRNWEAGKPLHENMSFSVYNCRKIIAVVSRHFLESNYCQDELSMALERVHRCGDSSLIVINLDGVPLESLPEALRSRTFLDLTSAAEKKTWRKRLYRQISTEEERQNNVSSSPVKVITTKTTNDGEDSESSCELTNKEILL